MSIPIPHGKSNASAFEDAFLEWAPQNRRLVLGPLLVGMPIDSILLGIVLAQAAYWRLKLEPYERWRMKLFVYYLLVASIVHTALIIAFSWVTFVDGFGNYATFFHTRLIKGPCIIETLIVVPIEIYYGKRAFRLWGRNKVVLVLLTIINLASAVLGMINVYTAPDSALTVLTGTFFLPWAISVMVLDCTTSGLIIAGLIKTRSGTQHGDQLLRKVIRLSAETQLVPSVITIVFILKAALGRYGLELNLICLSALSVPKIQIITCCLVINSRYGLRKSFEEERQRRQNTLEPLAIEAPALITGDSDPSTLMSLQDILGSPRSPTSPRVRQPLTSFSVTTSSQSRSQTRSHDKEPFHELELAYVHQLPFAGPGDGSAPGSFVPPRPFISPSDFETPMSFEEMLKMEK